MRWRSPHNPLFALWCDQSQSYRATAILSEITGNITSQSDSQILAPQVPANAKRMERKQLLTIETVTGIPQTDQMQAHNLQLVIPRGLHTTFTPTQQKTLLDLSGFNEMVRDRESRVGAA